jgi:hypothetical protein
MGRIHPECLDSDPSEWSVTANVRVREEPDEEEDEEEDDGKRMTMMTTKTTTAIGFYSYPITKGGVRD